MQQLIRVTLIFIYLYKDESDQVSIHIYIRNSIFRHLAANFNNSSFEYKKL